MPPIPSHLRIGSRLDSVCMVSEVLGGKGGFGSPCCFQTVLTVHHIYLDTTI
jgi:hypothetical protein